jgi:hypothetical protein
MRAGWHALSHCSPRSSFIAGGMHLAYCFWRLARRLAADATASAPKELTQEVVRLKGGAAAAKEAALLALCSRTFAGGRTIIFAKTKQRAHRWGARPRSPQPALVPRSAGRACDAPAAAGIRPHAWDLRRERSQRGGWPGRVPIPSALPAPPRPLPPSAPPPPRIGSRCCLGWPGCPPLWSFMAT